MSEKFHEDVLKESLEKFPEEFPWEFLREQFLQDFHKESQDKFSKGFVNFQKKIWQNEFLDGFKKKYFKYP